MLGDGMGVAAGLVDHQHARRGAGLDVDRVETRAITGDNQEVRGTVQQVGMEGSR